MKRITRLICMVLALSALLCACSTGSTSTTTTTTTPAPSTPPIPVMADTNRPLPVLPEKKVTDTPAVGDLVLAQEGVAMATIVYPKNHSKSHSAAKDLSDYLTKITGASFTMLTDDQPLPEGALILVGPTKKTFELGIDQLSGYPESERFYIGTQEGCLILYGNDSANYTGTAFAVTRFLEEAGCGWFTNEELWQIVPNKPTLAVKAWKQTFTPLFDSRTMNGIPSSLGKRWYLGGDQHSIGHGLPRLVSRSNYADHPEWFPMIDGVRPAPAGWWQYCYTNQGFAEAVAEKVVAYFNSNPNACNISIAANDGWDEGWCECDTCTAAGNSTDQILVFANRVAAIVSYFHPDKTLSILAYHSTFLPPQNTTAHPNVEVMFCMETNPFTDPTLDYVVHQGLNGITRVNYTQSWQDNCNEYIEKTDLQNISIWTWLCISGDAYQWYGAPWVQGNTISRTYALYQEMGVERVFADCGKELLWVRWPLFYTFARCMWDDTVDAETHLYDACQKLYGEAADEVFLYFRFLSDCAAICIDDGGITWVPSRIGIVYGEHIVALRETVAKIEATMDQLTPEQHERVTNLINSWNYTDKAM